jgi:hypothetical protein
VKKLSVSEFGCQLTEVYGERCRVTMIEVYGEICRVAMLLNDSLSCLKSKVYMPIQLLSKSRDHWKIIFMKTKPVSELPFVEYGKNMQEFFKQNIPQSV